jgi:hypothetical protein
VADDLSNDLDEAQWQQIEACIFAGRTIEAIKLVREFTGSSLADSKAAVDEHEAYLRSSHPERFTRSRASGCAGTSVLLLAVAVLGMLAAIG